MSYSLLLLCSKYNKHRDEAISSVVAYRRVKTGTGKLQSRDPKKVVAIAEGWCWIYIVPEQEMFKGKMASDAIRIME